eukprot:m.14122 g.14122  ORF g.14122 m.14122 type:complete len:96 (-) comp10303_c0_seq1:447-734(-)
MTCNMKVAKLDAARKAETLAVLGINWYCLHRRSTISSNMYAYSRPSSSSSTQTEYGYGMLPVIAECTSSRRNEYILIATTYIAAAAAFSDRLSTQ